MSYPDAVDREVGEDFMTYTVQSAKKVFDVVQAVQRLEEPTLTRIAADTGMPKTTTLTHLHTLEEIGYVLESDGEYRLSLRFLDHGVHTKRQLSIARLCPPVLQQLAEDTNEAAWLMVEERGYVIGLEKALGQRAVQTTGRIGRHTRFHYHAPGKAILSQFPDARVEELLERTGLPGKTDRTVTDVDELFAELEEVREQGVAFDVGEAVEGLRSVAAPVDSRDSTKSAIAVVGPENRLTGEVFRERIPELVSGAANELELRLRYGPP